MSQAAVHKHAIAADEEFKIARAEMEAEKIRLYKPPEITEFHRSSEDDPCQFLRCFAVRTFCRNSKRGEVSTRGGERERGRRIPCVLGCAQFVRERRDCHVRR